MSYWSRRSIAHMLVSFGFDDGERVAFSVEVRRERHEGYSEIGGFFKDFELSIIAADERDVVRLRTNVRGEDVYLYRVRMPVTAMRSLFLAYVEEANTLVEEPRFYQTITGNCTTLVYRFMKRICGHLPFDYRVLLSGYMPEYVYSVGGLDPRYALEELRAFGRINERGKQADRSDAFSARIRARHTGALTGAQARRGARAAERSTAVAAPVPRLECRQFSARRVDRDDARIGAEIQRETPRVEHLRHQANVRHAGGIAVTEAAGG